MSALKINGGAIIIGSLYWQDDLVNNDQIRKDWLEQIKSEFGKAKRTGSAQPAPYFYMGLAYKSLNQPTEAIAAFEEALVYAKDEVTRTRIRRHLSELYAE